MNNEPLDLGDDKSLLLVDDDEAFLRRLAKAMEKRGFEVEMAGSVAAGQAIATARPPAYAVVDLRLEDGNGLDVVETLRARRPESRIVVLTGYGDAAKNSGRNGWVGLEYIAPEALQHDAAISASEVAHWHAQNLLTLHHSFNHTLSWHSAATED